MSANQTRALLDAVRVRASSPGTAVFVGKDGGVSFDELFATIDRIPMRQR